MNTGTKATSLNLTDDAAAMLKAFTQARNGSIHNQASAAIVRGITELLDEGPEPLRQRYRQALAEVS